MDIIDPADSALDSSYSSPVDKLLTYGEPSSTDTAGWPNYLELGLTAEHIPDLIRMVLDEKLHQADFESVEAWAPIHAIRTIGQLHAVEAIKPLLAIFDIPQEDEWIIEELPLALSLIGPEAFPILEAYIADSANNQEARINAATAVRRIAEESPDLHTEGVRILSNQLDHNNTNDQELSGFIIDDLIDLHAIETMPAIERAIAEDRVDLSIAGDLDDVRERKKNRKR